MLMRLLCLLASITAVLAVEPTYVVQAWRTKEGLPSDHVTALAQTPDGMLWVGTDNGLVRFDGMRFSTVDAEAMRGEIRNVLTDGQGRLWIWIRDGGVFWYVDGKFEKQVIGVTVPEGMTCLATGEDGAVYAAGKEKFMRCANGKVEMEPLPMAADFSKLACTRDGTVFASQAGSMWTRRKGRWEEFRDFAPDGRGRGVQLMIDRAGALWMGFGQVWRQGEKGAEHFAFRGSETGFATALAEQPDGTVWASRSPGGLWRKEGDEFVPVPLPENHRTVPKIERFFVDRAGDLWAATSQEGLLSIARPRVETRLVEQAGGAGAISSLLELGPDDYLVGTLDHGAFRWREGKTEKFTDDADFVRYRTVNAIVKDRNGSLWLGTIAGLHEFRAESRDYRRIPHPELLKAVGSGNSATTLCEDAAGNLWMGCADGWVSRLTAGKRTAVMKTKPVNAIAATPDGTIWVGTASGGVQRISAGGEPLATRSDGLRSQRVTCLDVDSRGRVWAGTRGGGIGLWSPETESFRSLGTPEGLPEDVVLQIIEDGAGWLWLGGMRGIAGIRVEEIGEVLAGRRAKVEPLLLGDEDGMLTEQCTRMVPIKTGDGRLCFGTAQGFVLFDPTKETTFASAPEVLLEEVSVDDQVRLLGGPAPKLELPPGTARVQVRFTASGIRQASRTQFRYRMNGMDEAWTENGTSRLATFTHLKPGDYWLELQAKVPPGAWSTLPTALEVTQKPYFHQTPWFAVLAIGGLIATSAAVTWIAERTRHARRLASLEAINEERRRIAHDLHDGLGAGIAHANMLTYRVLGLVGARQSEPEQVDRLTRRMQSLSLDLDVAIWATDPKHDNLISFSRYLGDFAQEYFQDSGVGCTVDLPQNLPAIPMSPSLRHHLFMVVREVFGNVLKHAEASQVDLRLDFASGMLSIEIRDNGRGFDPAKIGSSRHGIVGMRERLSKIGGRLGVESSGSGTAVAIILRLKAIA